MQKIEEVNKRAREEEHFKYTKLQKKNCSQIEFRELK